MKNVKIGNTTYNGIKKLRVKQSDDTFVTFTDDDEITSSVKLAQVCSGTVTTLTQQDLAGCTSIKDYLFQFASLTSIDLPNTVTSIGNFAFANTHYLTSIEIPSSYDEREEVPKHYQQFSNSGLQSVTFREGAKTLSQLMFYQCFSLQNVTLPNSLVWTADNVFTNAFDGCSSFVGTSYNGIAYAGNTTNPYMIAVRITQSGLTSIALHPNCKMVCTDVFNDNSNLYSIQGVIVIPDNVLLASINEQNISMYASSVDMIELSSNMIGVDNLISYSNPTKYIGVKNPTIANIITSQLSSYSYSKSDKVLYKVETSELPASPVFDTNINSSLESTSQTYEFTNDSNIDSWSASCNDCGGSGSVYGQCTTCNGSGSVTEQPVDTNPDTGDPQYACPKCNRWGYIKCQTCNGMGVDITPTGEPFQVGTDLAGKTIYIAHSSDIDGENSDFIEVNNEFDMTAVSVENWQQELGREPTEEEDIPMFYIIGDDQSYVITSLNLHGHDNDYIIVTGTPCSAGCSYGGFVCDLCNEMGVTDNVLYTECPQCNGTGESFGYETCPDCGGSGQDSSSSTCSMCGGTGKQSCSNMNCNNGYVQSQCNTCGGSGSVSCSVCSGSDPECSECGGSGSVFCPDCNGTGIDQYNTEPCPNCNGTGEEDCYACGGSGVESGGMGGTCQTCGGSGQVTTNECQTCNGIGYVETSLTHTCPDCGGSCYNYNTCTTCNGQGRITDSNIITSPLYRIIGTNKYFRNLYNI